MSRLTRHPPITLHLGAHRTATTSLQRLMMRNAGDLRERGVVVWGPRQTRSGLLTGVLGDPGRVRLRRDVQAYRAAGRVALLRSDMTRAGIERLVISDENMLGGLRENLLLGRLYPSVSARLHRLAGALRGVERVCLSIRSPDAWWTSAFAFLMMRGFPPPEAATIDAILRARRTWRHVIEDVAAAFPEATLDVWTFEERASDPGGLHALLTGHAPARSGVPLVNASPSVGDLRDRLRDDGWTGELPAAGDGYAPFDADARIRLREVYAEDLDWLRDGADGIACYQGPGSEPVPRPSTGGRHEGFRPTSPPMGAAG
ncbi:MAG: hypothetical protein AAF390_01130 [Pseudomonadota bacterium]